ncbi:hypothetical protein D3C87_1356710 [compost metagenome]
MRGTDADRAQRLPQTDIGIRHSLAGNEAVADQAHDFRAFCKFAVVQPVTGLQLGQIKNSDTGLFQLAAIGFDGRVDLAQTVDIAGNAARQAERTVILRDEQGEFRRRLAEAGELPAEHVHIEIWCCQNDIADLRIDAAVADGHLAQRLHGKPCAHGMRHDRDLADRLVLCQTGQHFLKRIARVIGAFLVVIIVENTRP